MEEQVPAAVVSERYMRLVELQNEIAWEENKRKLGEVVEVIVREAEGKKDDRTDRLSGRARDNRLVHVAHTNARPGDVVTARVTYAAPYHLIADEILDVRRTVSGDRWEARTAAPTIGFGIPLMPKR